METLKVVKSGKSIQKCIEIPDAYLDRDLEITIRPVPAKKNYRHFLDSLFLRYPGTNPFEDIADPCRWEREIRSEW